MVCSVSFLLPLPLQLSALHTMGFTTVVMALILGLQLALEAAMGGKFERWQWRQPRLLAEWSPGDEKERERLMGPHVTSHEHFFTVLVAVSIFQLNEMLRDAHDVELYSLYYALFYAVLANSMRYAARFNDDDASHKLLWTGFQFGLLLMLEGLGTSTTEPSLTLKLSAAAVFSLLALGFAARVAPAVPSAYHFVAVYAGANVASAVSLVASAVAPWFSKYALYFIVAMNLVLVDALLLLSSLNQVALDADYIVSRFNGLFMEVCGRHSPHEPLTELNEPDGHP